jgi:ABC-type transport system involved in multi-copper enzyme maturation permease subunit
MSIKERGYAHWDGELMPGRFPWKPITRYGIRLTFKKKFFKFTFFLALVPSLVFLAGIYISERLDDFQFMVREEASFLDVTPAYFKAYFANDYLLFITTIILIFAGAGLISDDLRHNALQLYLSRPLKRRDFFIGKISVLLFFLGIMTLLPGLLLFVMKLVFAGSFKFFSQYPWLPLSILGFSVFISIFFALYALFLSSLSTNRRYVAILIFGLYPFSDILFSIFYGIFRNPYFALLSIKNNIQQMAAFFFRERLPYDIPWFYSAAILTAICVLAVFVLRCRVRGVEIIK